MKPIRYTAPKSTDPGITPVSAVRKVYSIATAHHGNTAEAAAKNIT